MINIKLTTPVWKKNEFGQFNRAADIQISSDFGAFSEGYTFLRTQIDELLQQQGAENSLILNLQALDEEIQRKSRTLQILNRDTAKTTKQLQRLQNFLERLGIDPNSYSLIIADGPLELSTPSGVAVKAQVDPIPFNYLGDDDDDSTDEF